MTGYLWTYLRATDVDLDEERVFRLDHIAAVWQGETLVMGTVSQQTHKTPSSRSPCSGEAPGPIINCSPAAGSQTPTTKREQEVAEARAVLGDARLVAFLRRCRGTENIDACDLINNELDRGESLDAIFYTGDDFGYQLGAKRTGPNGYDVAFGFSVDPEAVDGGEWAVSFSPDGEVQSIELGERWIT